MHEQFIGDKTPLFKLLLENCIGFKELFATHDVADIRNGKNRFYSQKDPGYHAYGSSWGNGGYCSISQ